MLNYFTHLTSFKQIGSSIENTKYQKKHHFYCVADTLKVMVWFFCFSIKDQICLKLIRCFCCYSASTKSSFGFCSCSEFLQLKFGDEKKLYREMQIAQSPRQLYVWQVANERYLPYLQLCGQAFLFILCIIGVKVAQS